MSAWEIDSEDIESALEAEDCFSAFRAIQVILSTLTGGYSDDGRGRLSKREQPCFIILTRHGPNPACGDAPVLQEEPQRTNQVVEKP